MELDDEYDFEGTVPEGLNDDEDTILDAGGRGKAIEYEAETEENDQENYVAAFSQYSQTTTTFGGGLSSVTTADYSNPGEYARQQAFAINMRTTILAEGFDFSSVASYMETIQKIPRYWVRNPKLIMDTFYLQTVLKGSPPTRKILEKVSTARKASVIDLYRYYKLMKN